MHLAPCTRLYALGSMHSALCAWLYALVSMHSALCTWLYALGSMHLALCTWLYALGSMHLALCTRLYAPGSVHSALCTRLCALASMHLALFHLAPCTWRYVFVSAQVTLCKLVRELRAEEPFAMLSGKRIGTLFWSVGFTGIGTLPQKEENRKQATGQLGFKSNSDPPTPTFRPRLVLPLPLAPPVRGDPVLGLPHGSTGDRRSATPTLFPLSVAQATWTMPRSSSISSREVRIRVPTFFCGPLPQKRVKGHYWGT